MFINHAFRRTVQSITPALKNLVIIGASLEENSFGRDLITPSPECTQCLRDATGINDLNVYGYGWSGYNISALLPKIDEALAAFPNNDTLFFIHIGGNNVTSTRPYSGMTPEQLSSFRSDLDLLFAKANSTNGRMIINDLTFRSYSDPLDLNSDSMFLNDINGSRPYIDNEYKPRQLLNQPEFLNSDNNSAVDVYNMVRNHWTALLRNDGIHFNISSYGALRKFIINRVAYLFNNTLKPTVVGPEPTREKIIVEIGNANRDNYNSVGYEYWPNNFLQFTTANIGSKPISRNTKTITGQDRGIMYLDTTATVIGTSGTDVVSGSNTIKPTTSYKDWEVRSFEIMGRSQYFNASHTITLRFEGLTPNKQYNVEFVGSRVAGDTRITRLTCLQNSNFGEINTSNSVPELGALVGVTDSSGIMTFVASCVLGTYGYLAGVSIEPIP